MNTKKVNPSILLCISFLSAAIGSPLICALCAGAILFLCEDKSLAGQSIEAVALAMFASLFSYALNVIRFFLRFMPFEAVQNFIREFIGIASNVVDLAVFIVGIIAAIKALKKEKVSIPLLSGKFNNIISE